MIINCLLLLQSRVIEKGCSTDCAGCPVKQETWTRGIHPAPDTCRQLAGCCPHPCGSTARHQHTYTHTAVRRRKTELCHFTSKQILPFDFAEQHTHSQTVWRSPSFPGLEGGVGGQPLFSGSPQKISEPRRNRRGYSRRESMYHLTFRRLRWIVSSGLDWRICHFTKWQIRQFNPEGRMIFLSPVWHFCSTRHPADSTILLMVSGRGVSTRYRPLLA